MLGASFMKYFYTVIDHENSYVGLALTVNSRGWIHNHFRPGVSITITLVFTTLILLTTIGVTFALANCRKQRWEKKLLTMRQMNDPNYYINDTESLSSMHSKTSLQL